MGNGFATPHTKAMAGRGLGEDAALGFTLRSKLLSVPWQHACRRREDSILRERFCICNDYSALLPDAPAVVDKPGAPLLTGEPARGICKVLCFHPDHSLTLARMTREEIRPVIDAWTGEYEALGSTGWIKHVQIFENRGAMMGASNPHPHGQIWATDFVPDEPALETEAQHEHLSKTGKCLLCEYVETERKAGERIVFENDHFLALVPWWATWPFETILLPKRHAGALPEFSSAERDGLADALKRMTTRFDNLFETLFPYTMGLHQMPTDGQAHPEWHFHLHFYRRCCARLRCGSLWWALRCWECRSATLRRKAPRRGCSAARKSISGQGLRWDKRRRTW